MNSFYVRISVACFAHERFEVRQTTKDSPADLLFLFFCIHFAGNEYKNDRKQSKNNPSNEMFTESPSTAITINHF